MRAQREYTGTVLASVMIELDCARSLVEVRSDAHQPPAVRRVRRRAQEGRRPLQNYWRPRNSRQSNAGDPRGDVRKSDISGKQRAGFAARAEIDRRECGLRWNQALETGGVLVGHSVKIEVEAQAAKEEAEEQKVAGTAASSGRQTSA